MVKTKDEILAAIAAITNNDTSDAAIALLEDVTDTLEAAASGLEAAARLTEAEAAYNEMIQDWEQRYNVLDNEWREKYRARFYDAAHVEDEQEAAPEKEDITIDDLFE